MKTTTAAVACVLSATFAMASAVAAEQQLAGERCDFFTINGATTQPTADSPFFGSIDFINLGSGEVRSTESTTVLLGIVGQDPASGTLSSITSHDIEASDEGVPFNLTTFDEQSLVPLENFGIEDPDFDFGLIGRLRVTAAGGRYSCGEVVSGLDPAGLPLSKIRLADPESGAPGQSTLGGFAKLCLCDANDN